MNRCIALCAFFFCLVSSTLVAQPIWKLRNIDVRVQRQIKPYTPLPDSFKTYRVVPSVVEDARFPFIQARMVQGAFRFETFQYSEAPSDFTIKVAVAMPLNPGSLTTRKDTTKQTYYQYQERIEAKVRVTLNDKSGRAWCVHDETMAGMYQTPESKQVIQVEREFNNRFKNPVYQSLGTEICSRALEKCMNLLVKRFDYQSETVSLYYPYKSDAAWTQHLGSIAASLGQLHKGRAQADILAELQPHIAFLTTTLESANPTASKTKYTYYACALNLANIYRCLDDYDRAFPYLQLLIDANCLLARQAIGQVARLKENFKHYTYYRQHGRSMAEDQQARLDSLGQQAELTGYIVLKNKTIVNGTILDLVENFKSYRVRLKYEKKLNASIADLDYTLDDVREIHLPGWDLAVTKYLSTFYLSQIATQPPGLALAHSLPLSAGKAAAKSMYFLKKSSDDDFEYLASANLSNHVRDCPAVLRRVQYGYYTKEQYLEVVEAYNQTCGQRTTKQNNTANKPNLPKKANSTPSNSPGFYWGLSTGMNNFTSMAGIHILARLHQRMFVRLGAGGGVWGGKLAAGLQYNLKRDMRYSKGWSFAAGYGHSTGIKSGIMVSLGAGSDTTGNIVEATIIPQPLGTLHISTIFNKFSSRKSGFFLELGYSIGLQKARWQVEGGDPLPKELRPWVRILQPGGLIVGAGINFGN
jgi:hypothetical protein